MEKQGGERMERKAEKRKVMRAVEKKVEIGETHVKEGQIKR